MFGDAAIRQPSGGGLIPVGSLRPTDRLHGVGAHVAASVRATTLLFALVFASVLAGAQTAAAVPRVGVLSFGSAPSGGTPDPVRGIQQGLRELGYVEGRSVVFERRYADGRPDPILSA
jgi:hypothetical protein